MGKMLEIPSVFWRGQSGTMLGLIAASAIAVAGWGLALGAMGGAADLEDRLLAAEADRAATNAELTAMSEELTGAREKLGAQSLAAADLEEVTREIGAGRAELDTLTAKIEESGGRLAELRSEIMQRQELLGDAAVTYRTTSRAKVRAQPTTESEALAVVPEGVPLTVFAVVENGTWYKVGRMGFMHRALLELDTATEKRLVIQ
jgi:septal ring factor EnvC (AmiA/AmiB activator)